VGLGLLAGCSLPLWGPPQGARVHRIARLGGGPPSPAGDALTTALRQGLRDLGYVVGENIHIEERYASSTDGIAAAAELVRLQPEVIVVPAIAAALAVRSASQTTPVVAAGAGDLVASGLASSHARPGGSVTGLSTPSLIGRQLQLLQEVVPGMWRLTVLFDSAIVTFRHEPLEAAAETLGLKLRFVGVDAAGELESGFESVAREQTDGLYVSGSPLITANQTRIGELAVRHRLPLMFADSEVGGRGGLIGYGPNRADLFRRAAGYVDKILKGTLPADLPIEQPTLFDLVINLKTAQTLGITVPSSVLDQATEVIR
jgi:putative tryptophan/tyrosine transport system substrate-binding protein